MGEANGTDKTTDISGNANTGKPKPKIEIVEGGNAYSLTGSISYLLKSNAYYYIIPFANIVIALWGIILNPVLILNIHAMETNFLKVAHYVWLGTAILALIRTKGAIMAILIPLSCATIIFQMPFGSLVLFLKLMFSTPYATAVSVITLLNFIYPQKEKDKQHL